MSEEIETIAIELPVDVVVRYCAPPGRVDSDQLLKDDNVIFRACLEALDREILNV